MSLALAFPMVGLSKMFADLVGYEVPARGRGPRWPSASRSSRAGRPHRASTSLDLDLWSELGLLIVLLLGHWLEMRALGHASGVEASTDAVA